jgi:hypothetical protein
MIESSMPHSICPLISALVVSITLLGSIFTPGAIVWAALPIGAVFAACFADFFFTTSAVVLQPIIGAWMAHIAGYPRFSGWIGWSILRRAISQKYVQQATAPAPAENSASKTTRAENGTGRGLRRSSPSSRSVSENIRATSSDVHRLTIRAI